MEFKNKYKIIKISNNSSSSKMAIEIFKEIFSNSKTLNIVVDDNKTSKLKYVINSVKDFWVPEDLDVSWEEKKLTFQEYVDCVRNPN